jgi:hypothetical protein
VQLAGSIVLLAAGAHGSGWILLGITLFGSGIGNATSLPPLIAQSEFVPQDVPRVVAWIVALGQATYAFAPFVLGAVLAGSGAVVAQVGRGTGGFFLAVAALQLVAIACFLAGRRRG